MRRHKASCVFCEKCKKFVDVRHLEKCKGKPVVGDTIWCLVCRKFRSRKNFSRHMLAKHGVDKWREGDHPEFLTKVCCVFFE